MAKYIALFVLFIAMTNALHHQGDFLRARIRGNNYLLLTQCSFCPEVNFGTTLQPKMITLNVFVGENSTKTGS
jgi:hypothetical protein